MRNFNVFVLALVMGLASTSSFAKGQDRPGADKRHCQTQLPGNAEKLRANFMALDTDRDGLLTEKESSLRRDARMCFDRLDQNRDHQLSVAELAVG